MCAPDKYTDNAICYQVKGYLLCIRMQHKGSCWCAEACTVHMSHSHWCTESGMSACTPQRWYWCTPQIWKSHRQVLYSARLIQSPNSQSNYKSNFPQITSVLYRPTKKLEFYSDSLTFIRYLNQVSHLDFFITLKLFFLESTEFLTSHVCISFFFYF